MNILLLTNAYPDFEASYRGVFVQNMAAHLLEEGYGICVVTPKIYRNSPYHEKKGGIKTYRFPFFAQGKLLIEYKKIPYLKMLLYYLMGFLWTVYGVVKNRCDVIHVHWAIPTGLIGVLVGKLLTKPILVTIHGSDFRMATERSKLLKIIFLYICRQAKQVVCVSEFQAIEIKKMGIKGDKVSTLPMGVEEGFWEAGRNRKEKLGACEHTILSNRNLLPIYNVSLLIRAIPLILKEEPWTKFLIAGEGGEREALEKEVKGLNVDSSVTFLGRVAHEEMPGLLSRADIYVSTSLHDGASVSLLEALASGAFPIVTDIPSNREWISDGDNGFLVAKESQDLLAEKILGAIRNHQLLEEALIKNRELVERRAHWRENIRKFTRFYQSL